MLTVFAAVAELEREYLLQRQREGIAIAKQAGKYKGRKPIDRTALQPVLDEYRKGNLTATQAMRKMNVSKSTFYRMFIIRITNLLKGADQNGFRTNGADDGKSIPSHNIAEISILDASQPAQPILESNGAEYPMANGNAGK